MNTASVFQGMLESLGWAILHSFWQMAALWLAYQLVFTWRRGISPAIRHNAALALMVIGTGWFIATCIGQYREYLSVGRYLAQFPEDPVQASIQVNQAMLSFASVRTFFAALVEANIQWVSALYLLILCVMSWRLLQGLRYARTLRHRGLLAIEPEWQLATDRYARQLGIGSRVRVYLSQLVDVPATLGYLKPVILLPAACITQLTPAQLESILLHELAHIRRKDYLVNILVAFMETLLFFNPFTRLLARHIRRERELSCDDLVLSGIPEPIDYATALLSIEKIRRGPVAALAMASNGTKGQLLSRIRRITRVQEDRRPYTDRLLALCLMFLLMLSMSWIRPQASLASTPMEKHTDALIETEEEVILRLPPQPALAGKPGTLATARTRKTTGTGPQQQLHKRMDLNVETLILDESRPAGMPRVYVNEAPPEGYQFVYTLPIETDLPELEMLRKANDLSAQEQLMYQQRVEKLLQDRIRFDEERMRVQGVPGEFLDTEPFKVFEGQRIPFKAEQFRNEFRSQRLVPRRAPKAEKQEQPRAIQPDLFTFVHPTVPVPADPEWFDAIVEEKIVSAQAPSKPRIIMGRTKGVALASPKTEVRVNRVKTRDGYTLRIETGKESIDIRIAEDDIVVEKEH